MSQESSACTPKQFVYKMMICVSTTVMNIDIILVHKYHAYYRLYTITYQNTTYIYVSYIYIYHTYVYIYILHIHYIFHDVTMTWSSLKVPGSPAGSCLCRRTSVALAAQQGAAQAAWRISIWYTIIHNYTQLLFDIYVQTPTYVNMKPPWIYG